MRQEPAPPLENPGDSIVVSEFSSEYKAFEAALDMEFAREIMDELSRVGDDPATGFRSAGSPAEGRAADIVERAMREAGLSNIVREQAKVESWTFAGADLAYADRRGESRKIALGGCPVNLKAVNEAVMLVDLGKGRLADYEGKDIDGKLALIDLDPSDPWGAGYPAYQARLLGARAVIAKAGMEAESAGRLYTPELRGPSDAPMLVISEEGAAALRDELRRSENGEIPVMLNADSIVAGGGSTANIWGEIPGRTEDVIYMTGGYDGFYRSAFESAAGLSAMLGIAKAMVDSGFVPNKTIRFIACGAGEWGASGSLWGWGAGAWAQISQNHPEWAESAFAAINVDGSPPIANETRFGVSAPYELCDFVSLSAGQLVGSSMYNFSWHVPETGLDPVTDYFGWTLQGVPMVSAGPNGSGRYISAYRHSSDDSVEAAGFDEDAYRFCHMLYGKLAIDLDDELIRPLDFEAAFRALLDSFEGGPAAGAALTGALLDAAGKAAKLTAAIDRANMDYLTASEELKPSMEAMAFGLNRELFRLFKGIRDGFARMAWNGDAALSHTGPQRNIGALRQARDLLEGGDAEGALEALKKTDFGSLAGMFSEGTLDYFAGLDGAGTWSEGRMAGPACRADAVIESLSQKIADKNPELRPETDSAEALLAREEALFNEACAAGLAAVQESAARIDGLLADYLGDG
jgi:hypothetical protein